MIDAWTGFRQMSDFIQSALSVRTRPVTVTTGCFDRSRPLRCLNGGNTVRSIVDYVLNRCALPASSTCRKVVQLNRRNSFARETIHHDPDTVFSASLCDAAK